MKDSEKCSSILCITSSYPYGKRETYFENELMYLSQSFDIVYILPIYNPSGSTEQRAVPSNVHVLPLVAPTDKLLKITKGIFNCSPSILFIRDCFSKKVFLERSKMSNWFNSFLIFRLLYKRIKGLYQVINTNTIFYAYWASAALVFPTSIMSGYKKVVRMHGQDFYLERNNGYLPIRKSIYDSADLLLPISNNIAGILLNQYRVNSSKVFVNYLGVNNDRIVCANKSEVIRVVTCSNLYPLKRIHLIPAILKNIDSSHNIEWHHFGDGPEKSRILDLCAGLPKNVSYTFHGWVTTENLYDFYQNNFVNWIINLSVYEGVPVSIMEAFSFGIPAIATNVGATMEIVSADNGYLITSEIDTKEVARLIIAIDKSYVKKRSDAYNTWQRQFSANQNYSNLVQHKIFRSVI